MADIMLDRQKLRDTRDGLQAAITAFEDASQTNDDLEEAVANPHGKNSLRDRVGWFEANWKSNREDLKDRLADVHERLDGIVTGWDDWENQTAESLENAEG